MPPCWTHALGVSSAAAPRSTSPLETAAVTAPIPAMKTNAARILDRLGIPYTLKSYEVGVGAAFGGGFA